MDCLNSWSTANGFQVQFKISGFGCPLPFLDIELYFNNNNWQSRLYSKTTDVHAYVLPTSCHPPSVCKAIPRSIAIRIFRVCTEKHEYNRSWVLFRDKYFLNRGYDKFAIDKVFREVKRLNRKLLLTPKRKQPATLSRVPFVAPYGNNTKHVGSILRNVASLSQARNYHRPNSLEFPQRPVFKVGASLKKRLVKSSFLRPIVRKHGCYKCGLPTCHVDSFLQEVSDISSDVTGVTFPIVHALSCNSSNVVYVVRCKRCNKQGVGETHDPRQRLQSYIQAAGSSAPTSTSGVEAHFSDFDHDPGDLEFFLVDCVPAYGSNCKACDHSERCRLESIWINRLDCKHPRGLNKRTQPRFSFTGHSCSNVSRNPPNTVSFEE